MLYIVGGGAAVAHSGATRGSLDCAGTGGAAAADDPAQGAGGGAL